MDLLYFKYGTRLNNDMELVFILWNSFTRHMALVFITWNSFFFKYGTHLLQHGTHLLQHGTRLYNMELV